MTLENKYLDDIQDWRAHWDITALATHHLCLLEDPRLPGLLWLGPGGGGGEGGEGWT